MRVLIASRSVAHYPYFRSMVEELEHRGHECVMLFDRKWSSGARFDHLDGRAIQWLVRRTEHRSSVFAIREIRNYLNYDRQKDQSPYYKKRWGEYIPRWARYLPACLLPVLEWIEDHTKPDRSVVSHIRSINPDVIVACPANHRFSEEIEYIKSGNEFGIPTAIINYSWDNLTTKGTYHAKPDMFFVWNETQKQDAVEIHSIPEESIVISGAPFFDKWFELPKIVEDRARFCSRYGLDPDKPYVLYLGSSAKIAPDETAIIGRFLKYHQVLFRPHPANYKFYMMNMDLKTMPPTLIDDENSRLEFAKAVKFSEFVFGINNSAMIDAVLNGGECRSELLDGYYETQCATMHFADMYTWMNDEDFERDFIWPCNFRASFVISNHLEGLCSR